MDDLSIASLTVLHSIPPCRYDWHQTGTQVVVSFYAKACLPEQCLFEANQTSVSETPPSFYRNLVVSAVLCISLLQSRILLLFDNGKNQQFIEFRFYGVRTGPIGSCDSLNVTHHYDSHAHCYVHMGVVILPLTFVWLSPSPPSLSLPPSLPSSLQIVDVERSSVELLGTKAELKLRKADPVSWASLELKAPPPPQDDKSGE